MSLFPDSNIAIEEFNYALPAERIARYPLSRRDEAKLLVYQKGQIRHVRFKQLPDLLGKEDLLIINNTRVIQARVLFTKPSGANIEIFCLEPVDPSGYELSFSSTHSVAWKCLIGNAKKWRNGALVKSVGAISLTAVQIKKAGGEWIIRFTWDPVELTFSEVLEQTGKTPIPPYLNRESESSDKTNYQTVYSRYKGSVAAPTAGLHFTEEVLQNLIVKGIQHMELTLHVGAGTFRPIIDADVGKHPMHAEHIYFGREELHRLLTWENDIVAVGTTTARTLESIYWLGCKVIIDDGILPEDLNLSQWEAYNLDHTGKYESLTALSDYFERNGIERFETTTELMIVPGYTFRMVNKLITNFHQPKSTLLLLVSAFIGNDWKEVYRYALDNDFRLLSYGDTSLLIPNNE